MPARMHASNSIVEASRHTPVDIPGIQHKAAETVLRMVEDLKQSMG